MDLPTSPLPSGAGAPSGNRISIIPPVEAAQPTTSSSSSPAGIPQLIPPMPTSSSSPAQNLIPTIPPMSSQPRSQSTTHHLPPQPQSLHQPQPLHQPHQPQPHQPQPLHQPHQPHPHQAQPHHPHPHSQPHHHQQTSTALQTQGLVVKKRKHQTNEGYLSTASTLAASLLPASLWDQWTSSGAAGESGGEKRELVWWSCFQYSDCLTPSVPRVYLLLGLSCGFQVWSVDDGEAAAEVVSKREQGPVRLLRFLPQPFDERDGSPLQRGRPLLAVLSGDGAHSAWPGNVVKFYSLRARNYVNQLKLPSDVLDVQASKTLFLTQHLDSVFAFDPVTMKKLFHLRFSPPDALGAPVVALGPRWLALPSLRAAPVALSADRTPYAVASRLFSVAGSAVASGLGALSTAASNLYSGTNPSVLDDSFSHTHHHPSLYPSAAAIAAAGTGGGGVPLPTPDGSSLLASGSVEIFDVGNQQVVAHFQAHNEPIAALTFSPNGSLLATADTSGTELHLYQISPPGPLEDRPAQRLIYVLHRGLTRAAVQALTFSHDSRWLALTSAHGTTHVFAILPEGGAVNVFTHGPGYLQYRNLPPASHSSSSSSSSSSLSPNSVIPVVTLTPVCRIKHTTPPASYFSSSSSSANPASITAISTSSSSSSSSPSSADRPFAAVSVAFAHYRDHHNPSVLHVDAAATLVQQMLHATAPPPDSGLDRHALLVVADPGFEWDCSRRASNAEHFAQVPVAAEASSREQHLLQWLHNVETATHSSESAQLWRLPLFSFQAFVTADDRHQELFHPETHLLARGPGASSLRDEYFELRPTTPIVVRSTAPEAFQHTPGAPPPVVMGMGAPSGDLDHRRAASQPFSQIADALNMQLKRASPSPQPLSADEQRIRQFHAFVSGRQGQPSSSPSADLRKSFTLEDLPPAGLNPLPGTSAGHHRSDPRRSFTAEDLEDYRRTLAAKQQASADPYGRTTYDLLQLAQERQRQRAAALQDPRYPSSSGPSSDPRILAALQQDVRYPSSSDPRYPSSSSDPRYQDPRYATTDPRYQYPSDPRYPSSTSDHRYPSSATDPRIAAALAQSGSSRPTDPRYADPRLVDPRIAAALAQSGSSRQTDPRYTDPRYQSSAAGDPLRQSSRGQTAEEADRARMIALANERLRQRNGETSSRAPDPSSPSALTNAEQLLALTQQRLRERQAAGGRPAEPSAPSQEDLERLKALAILRSRSGQGGGSSSPYDQRAPGSTLTKEQLLALAQRSSSRSPSSASPGMDQDVAALRAALLNGQR